MRGLISTSALVAVAAFALAPSAAMAVPFTSNPVGAGLASGASSDANFVVDTFAADDFVLAVDSKITGVTWYGNATDLDGNGTILPDDFQVSFFADDTGFPGADVGPAFSGPDLPLTVIDSGLDDASGQDIFEYSAIIDGPVLDAGVTYWLGVQNFLEDLVTDGDEWVWALSSTAGSYFFDDGAPTVSLVGTNNLAFSLTGEEIVSVSEPAALSLLGFGLMGVAVVARRRR